MKFYYEYLWQSVFIFLQQMNEKKKNIWPIKLLLKSRWFCYNGLWGCFFFPDGRNILYKITKFWTFNICLTMKLDQLKHSLDSRSEYSYSFLIIFPEEGLIHKIQIPEIFVHRFFRNVAERELSSKAVWLHQDNMDV